MRKLDELGRTSSLSHSKHRTMGSKVVIVMVKCSVLLVMFGSVLSDLAADKRECSDQLTSLSVCLPFVRGDTKAPALTCCSTLREEMIRTRKCLCVLVKDRNDPNLGIKINATLALSLPSICHAPANVSACPELLHLAPNSTDARVFEDFAASNKSSAVAAGDTTNSSNGTRENKWLQASVVVMIIASALTIAG